MASIHSMPWFHYYGQWTQTTRSDGSAVDRNSQKTTTYSWIPQRTLATAPACTSWCNILAPNSCGLERNFKAKVCLRSEGLKWSCTRLKYTPTVQLSLRLKLTSFRYLICLLIAYISLIQQGDCSVLIYILYIYCEAEDAERYYVQKVPNNEISCKTEAWCMERRMLPLLRSTYAIYLEMFHYRTKFTLRQSRVCRCVMLVL